MLQKTIDMKKHVLVLGCMIFGEAKTEVITIERVKIFGTEKEVDEAIDELEDSWHFNGSENVDSYVVLNGTTPSELFREEYEEIMEKFLAYETDGPIDDLVYIIEHRETNV